MAKEVARFPRQQSASVESGHSRVPPHSIQAEESVLGAVLLDNDSLDAALEHISHKDFYRAAHRVVFEAMEQLGERSEPVDIVTLGEQLKRNGYLEESGGMENLARLASLVPSAGNMSHYAKLVQEHSLRRNVIHKASELIQDAFEQSGDIEEFLDTCETKILQVADQRASQAFYRVGDVVQESIKTVEKLYDRQEPVTGVPSGFLKLDELTAGFQPADLIILAARPSMGKTALALSMAQYAAMDHGKAIAVFSLEMSKEQLVMRMLCSTAKVDSSKVRTGKLGESDFPKLVDAASRIADAPIFIDDTPAVTINEMRAKCRRLHRDSPLSLVIVDYLQLMRSPAHSDSREQEISTISRSLKGLAKELSIPVIALSQLNRSLESRTDKRPIMSDLRESGAIEQDADVIGFIYRDEVYNDDTTDKGVAELIIAKQRNGPTGLVRLAFLPTYTLFANLDERSDFGDNPGSGESEIDFSELDADLF